MWLPNGPATAAAADHTPEQQPRLAKLIYHPGSNLWHIPCKTAYIVVTGHTRVPLQLHVQRGSKIKQG